MWLKANMAALKLTSELGRPSLSFSFRCFLKERRNPVMAIARKANVNLISMAQRRWSQGLILRTDCVRETLRCVAWVPMSLWFRLVFGDAVPYLCPEKLFHWLLVRRKI